jgi:hypothetical protein
LSAFVNVHFRRTENVSDNWLAGGGYQIYKYKNKNNRKKQKKKLQQLAVHDTVALLRNL